MGFTGSAKTHLPDPIWRPGPLYVLIHSTPFSSVHISHIDFKVSNRCLVENRSIPFFPPSCYKQWSNEPLPVIAFCGRFWNSRPHHERHFCWIGYQETHSMSMLCLYDPRIFKYWWPNIIEILASSPNFEARATIQNDRITGNYWTYLDLDLKLVRNPRPNVWTESRSRLQKVVDMCQQSLI